MVYNPNHLPALSDGVAITLPKSTCFAEVIGGASVAIITGLALLIIFGPLAAIAGACIGGIFGAYAGLKVSLCCFSNETVIFGHVLLTPEEVAERARLNVNLDRAEQESERLKARRRELLALDQR